MRLHCPLIAASLLIAAAPSSARAAVSPDQAKSVEGQLQTWYATTFDKPAKPGVRAVQVEPAGDRYQISIPLGLKGTGDNMLAATMLANPAENGRWVFDNLRFPQPFGYGVTITPQKPPGPSTGQKGAAKEADVPVMVHTTITVVSQDGSGVWDPTFATPSTFKQTLGGLVSTSTASPITPSSGNPASTPADTITQRNTIDSSVTETTLTPNGRDKVDIANASSLTGYDLQTKAKDGPALDLNAKAVTVTLNVSAVPRERGIEVVRALSDLFSAGIPGMNKGGTAGSSPAPVDAKLSPAAFAALRRVVIALPDLGTGFVVDESATDLSVNAGGKSFAAAKVGFGMTMQSTTGAVQAGMGFAADGMVWPDLGMGDLEQLLPKHVMLRPTVSGISGQDLADLILAAVDTGQLGKPGPGDAALKARLLSRGAIIGIEALEFDTAGTTVSATGTISIQGGPAGVPRAQNGSAHIVAHDLDKLTAVVAAQPMLAQGMPAIVFLKGLAKQADGDSIWDVTFDGAKLAVNGTDMSAMMGGAR